MGLHIGGDGPVPGPGDASPKGLGPPYGGRVWDGNNPFHQPAATTDYYGSGDVNADGQRDGDDGLLARQMADGTIPPSCQADVDGDGDVDRDDVELIEGSLQGNVLPAWWNLLTTRAQRDAWVTRMMEQDATNRHPYAYWYQCLTFAVQMHIHAS